MYTFLLSKQRRTLHLEYGDLDHKLTNLQPNFYDFLIAHQTHPSD